MPKVKYIAGKEPHAKEHRMIFRLLGLPHDHPADDDANHREAGKDNRLDLPGEVGKDQHHQSGRDGADAEPQKPDTRRQ